MQIHKRTSRNELVTKNHKACHKRCHTHTHTHTHTHKRAVTKNDAQ